MDKPKNMDRRSFLKYLGIGAAATVTALAGCKNNSNTGALKRHPRDSYYIATKMSNHRLVGQGSSPQELYDESVKMYRNSFRDLQTDYIDYYLFLLSRHDEFHWDFVQIQLNYVDWDDKSNLRRGMPEAEYLYRELAARNIPVVIMEPLLGGRLAKVPKNVEAKMKQRRPDDSIASWAFRYAGTFPEVLTVLSGMTYMEHLQDNLATYSPLNPLNDDERTFLHLAALDILQNATVPCTDCRYCLPCPYGLDIPGIFRHYNKCINDDNAPRDVNDPRYAEARRAYLVGYDREVPRLRQANRCVQCRACEHKCPQQLPIVEHLANISHYTEQLRQGKA